MSKITITLAKPGDAKGFEAHPDDSLEIFNLDRRTPEQAVLDSINGSRRAYSVFADSQLVAVFGVGHSEETPTHGIIWMVRTTRFESFPKKLFIVLVLFKLQELSEGYARVGNIVWAENTKTIKWLKSVGFTFGNPFVLDHNDGMEPHPFIPFWRDT